MSTLSRCDLMKRSRRKKSCGGIAGKHSLQRRGRGVRAQLAVGPQHLAVAMADREVLVQRVEDRRVGEHAPDRRHEVVPDEERVLEVHDVGLVRPDELREVLRVEVLVAGGHREEVEVVGLRVEEVLVRIVADGAERGAGVRRPRGRDVGPDPRDQQRLELVGVPQRSRTAPARSLRAPREEGRVVVQHVENLGLLHVGQPCSDPRPEKKRSQRRPRARSSPRRRASPARTGGRVGQVVHGAKVPLAGDAPVTLLHLAEELGMVVANAASRGTTRNSTPSLARAAASAVASPEVATTTVAFSGGGCRGTRSIERCVSGGRTLPAGAGAPSRGLRTANCELSCPPRSLRVRS